MKTFFEDRQKTERLGLGLLSVVLVAAAAYAIVKGQRQPAPIVFQSSPAPTGVNAPASAQELSEPAEVAVHVVGSVNKPGLLRLPTGSRVNDAIRAAGGAKTDADTAAINLAAKLVNGSQLAVPSKVVAAKAPSSDSSITTSRTRMPKPMSQGERPVIISGIYKSEIEPSYSTTPEATQPVAAPSAPNARFEKKQAPSGPVSLNTATAAELESLPGVGPATAKKILDYRREKGAFGSIEELMAVKGIGPKKMESLRPYVKL